MQIQVEVSQLVDEINRVASQAQFNGMNLLTGRFAQGATETMPIQVGANMDQNKTLYIGTMTAGALFTSADAPAASVLIDLTDSTKANSAIGVLDTALGKISKQRADLGAYQNRMEMASNGVQIAAENMQASESRIRDTDMASMMVDYTKNQILTQAGTAMLAQANQRNQGVLQLLQ
jgi:flagellin